MNRLLGMLRTTSSSRIVLTRPRIQRPLRIHAPDLGLPPRVHSTWRTLLPAFRLVGRVMPEHQRKITSPRHGRLCLVCFEA